MNKFYRSYLFSEHWRNKRKEALSHYGNRCAWCGRKTRLHVHHKTYKHLGDEPMKDLQVLCHICHNIKHRHYWKALWLFVKENL